MGISLEDNMNYQLQSGVCDRMVKAHIEEF